ncbi:MAG TPA: plasmid pRiA4b ORF-3 family protein [Gemmatimonadales bacterium]|jgi:hypothetical protein|nr:plasmid pRiA4b ORF-3 family protein [Gemmatimonadales bacterium]
MGLPARTRVRSGSGDVYQLRVELEGITPMVWRRVAVSARATLHELHDILQCLLDRDDAIADGYAFEVDGLRYADRDSDPAPGHATEMVALESLALHEGSRTLHVAEHHAETWRDTVTLEQMHPRFVGQRLPICLGGGRAAPPPDCDGPRDYASLLDALTEPLDARAAERRSWLPEHFDPEYFNLVALNAALGRIPPHRAGGDALRHRR